MKCRICGESDLSPVLSLGNVPLSNAFLKERNGHEERFPLDVVFCPGCSLVQITETVPPEKLFSHYLYFSSISQTMVQHAKELADELIDQRKLTEKSMVVELASNDGYLLQHFQKRGIPVLGIDPAENVCQVANARGIPTKCAFFGEKLADEIEPADVVLGLNVLGHVADITGFVRGVRKILKPDGVAVFEVPYVRDMVDEVAFDTIYHEHLCYFSLSSLINLCDGSNLQLFHAERQDIHGGSLRIYVQHPREHFNRRLNRMVKIEKALGVDRLEYYRYFANRVKDLGVLLRTLLKGLREQGQQVVGYGAAAKGTMLLNYIGEPSQALNYVVDATPAKQGLLIPGVHIPIVPPERIGDPDYILMLAWNFKSEIERKHPEFKGRWILPVPAPRVE